METPSEENVAHDELQQQHNDDDEVFDYGVLLPKDNKMQSSSNTGQPNDVEDVALSKSLDAMYMLLDQEIIVNRKRAMVGYYDESCHLIRTSQSSWTQTMGRMKNGHMHLYPEEAMFLIERGSLVMENASSDSNSDSEGLVMSMSIEEARRLLVRNKREAMIYKVYAHLRRLGYIVRRSDISSHSHPHNARSHLHNAHSERSQSTPKPSRFIRLFLILIKPFTKLIRVLFSFLLKTLTHSPHFPLIPNKPYIHISEVYKSLDTLKYYSLPIFQNRRPNVKKSGQQGWKLSGEPVPPPTLPTKFQSPTTSSLSLPHLKPTFDVYLPNKFRKSAPGMPEFRVLIVSPDDELTAQDICSLPTDTELKVAVVSDGSSPTFFGLTGIMHVR